MQEAACAADRDRKILLVLVAKRAAEAQGEIFDEVINIPYIF